MVLVTFEIAGDGFEGLARELMGVEDRLLGQLDQAVVDAAGVGVESARADVRVDSGDLRESIESHRVSWGHVQVTAGTGLSYGAAIERLDPFFQPSIEDARADLRQRILSTGLG